MKQKLFKYAILLHPSDGQTVILKEPTSLLAVNEEQAKVLVSREIPAKYLNKLGEVEMIIRPF